MFFMRGFRLCDKNREYLEVWSRREEEREFGREKSEVRRKKFEERS
tara:strand:- start:10849 stop:10986 length:138 start_codon:yes stop_codon:yes gene_type:complete